MPANPRSLRLTDLYGRRLKAASIQLVRQVQARWAMTGDFDADYAAWLAFAIPATIATQRFNVQLTAGYIGAYESSERGRRVSPPRLDVDSVVGRSRDGRPLEEAWDSPPIKAKVAVSAGKTIPEASNIAYDAASRLVRFDADETARIVMANHIRQNDGVIGYRRVSQGETTCGGCLAAEDGEILLPTEDFASHPGCDCVAEPVYGEVDDLFRHPTGQQRYDQLSAEEKVEAVGAEAAQLMDSDEIRLAQLQDRFKTAVGQDFLVQRPIKDVN